MSDRRGIVLVLVLVVITLLALGALTLSELTVAERRAAQLTGQQAQARALAESGVEFARHFLDSDPDTQNQAGGWYDNAQQFCASVVLDGADPKDRGRFTILAPRVDDTTDTQVRYGLSDESARINLATVLALDKKTPGTGDQILMNLPGMTQDIADALGVTREPTPRLRHVAHIGVGARVFSYAVHGETPPPDPVRVELIAPEGALWTWGPEDAKDRVTGPALDFCLLVTQRRHRDDLALAVTGPAATEWMAIAQAFAGAAGTGRSPGQFG